LNNIISYHGKAVSISRWVLRLAFYFKPKPSEEEKKERAFINHGKAVSISRWVLRLAF